MAWNSMRGLIGFGVVALASALWIPGCGGDDVGFDGGTVGGACRDDFDCEYRCVRGGAYPDGTCTVPCRFHEDCPGGSWCVDRSGGICMLECRDHLDCRPGYHCDSQDALGSGGEVFVCIG